MADSLDPQQFVDASSNAKQLTDSLEQAARAGQRLSDNQKEVLNISKQLSQLYNEVAKSISLREQSEKKNLSYSQQLRDQLSKIKKDTIDLTKLETEKSKQLAKVLTHGREQIRLNREILNIEEQIGQAYADRENARRLGVSYDNRIITDLKESLKINNKQLSIHEKLTNDAKQQYKFLQQTIKDQEKLNTLIEEEVKALEKAIKIAQLKELKEGIQSGLESLIGFKLTLSSIIDILFKADESTTKLANNLGISRKTAQGLRNDYSSFVRSIDDAGLSTEGMIEAQLGLSKELGIAVRFSNEELQTFNRLTKVMGVSAGAAAKLNLIAKASGTEYKNIQSNILKGAIAQKNQLSVGIDNKEVFEEIGKLSAGILVKFQNNPEALGAAVVQAKKLGLSLEQVDKVGESLLNWESSIETELKAELLTGRELNVERARAAALTGDQATLMAEIASQAGTLENFNKLNVLAQRSLAEAFGLSKDEMAEMLMKQELINQYGDKANKLNKEQAEEFKKSGLSLDEYLKQQGAQVALQEQFNNSINQLKELLISITQGPFGTLVGMVSSLLTDFGLIYPIVGAIATLLAVNMVSGIINFGKGILTAIPAMANLLGLTSATAIAEMSAVSAATLGLGMAAIVGGIIYAVSAMNSATADAQRIEDGIAPPGSGPFTITDGFGRTSITAAGDGLAVSPNINRINNTSTNNSSTNNDAMLARIDRLISVTQQGRVSVWNDQIVARENLRSTNMNNPIYFS